MKLYVPVDCLVCVNATFAMGKYVDYAPRQVAADATGVGMTRGETVDRGKVMRLLDLFCGAGGAAMGYHRSGFDEIVGVDIAPQKNYPFEFVQGDALEFVDVHGHEFNAIHASPPCQGYSVTRHLPWLKGKEYPLLIDDTRELLQASGKPWIVENVMGAKLDANWLCGMMFDLPFFRHRYFETNWLWFAPIHPPHEEWIRIPGGKDSLAVCQRRRVTIRNGRMLGSRARDIVHSGISSASGIGHAAGVALVREAMQIDWMTRDELTQAIPPAYTQYVGEQLMRYL